jgi:biopolymer transport protein ExbD
MPTPARAARPASALENEINVTPMIDVLLVLLIIFMTAIPTMRKSIDVQVPDRSSPSRSAGTPSIVLEIDAQGAYSINRSFVPHDQLRSRLREIFGARPDEVLFVKGHGRVKYAHVVEAMDVARGAGVKVLGLP